MVQDERTWVASYWVVTHRIRKIKRDDPVFESSEYEFFMTYEFLFVCHAGCINRIAFVVALGISMGYYQFVYVPEANKKPIVPEEVLNPVETLQVEIALGASLETNEEFFVPEEARATIGISNRILWTNEDTIAHTVTSEYVDQINGPFNSLEQQEQVPGDIC